MMKSAIIGYPYIGEQQQWIETREQFRTHKISSNEFKQQHIAAMIASLRKQQEMGLHVLTIGDYPMLDRMLDMAFMFNLIPSRFTAQHDTRTMALYFDMAYGHTASKCTLNNWFETTYCYVEPEYEQQTIKFNDLYFQEVIEQCQETLQTTPRITLIGPMTFMALTKGIDKDNKKAFRQQLVKGYLQLMKLLQRLNVEWVQLEEPVLANQLNSTDLALVRFFYQQLTENSQLKVMLTVPYEMPQQAQLLAELPIDGIGFDLTKVDLPELNLRPNIVLALGVIDATNVWAMNEQRVLSRIQKAQSLYPQQECWLQSSASLMHIPITKKEEWLLLRDVYKRLAFADEKIAELVQLTKTLRTAKAYRQTDVVHSEQAEQNVWPMPIKKGNRTNIGRRWRLQQAFLQLEQTVLMTNECRLQDVQSLNDAYKLAYSNSTIDLPAYAPCPNDQLIQFVAARLTGMVTTEFGAILISFYEAFTPPIQYGAVQWKNEIFGSHLKQLRKIYSGNVKVVIPGPISVVKASFLSEQFTSEMIVYQMIQAFRQELQSLEHRNIQMLQLEENWLYRKLPTKCREQQRNLKLELELLQNCLSSVREMTVIQVCTKVWKYNVNELLKSNIIDVVSFDFENGHVEELLSTSAVKVAVSVNISSFIVNETIQWARVDDMKIAFKDRMFWINVDLKRAEKKRYIQLLKALKKENVNIPLRYISD